MFSMKQIVKPITLAALLATTLSPPVALAGGETTAENPEVSEGAELVNRGFRLLLDGLAKEVGPMAGQWAEGWAQLAQRFGDLSAYHPPETLPNGDIIIRRRMPLATEKTPGETEL